MRSARLALALSLVGLSCGTPSSTPEDAAQPGDADSSVDAAEDADADHEIDADLDTDVDGDPSGEPSCDLDVLDQPCVDGVGDLEGTTCTTLLVACPDLGAVEVQVRETLPPAGREAFGVILAASHGDGTAFFESDATARALLETLLEEGHVVVQRAWEQPWWALSEDGPAVAANRMASLLDWIDARHERPTGRAFCAIGDGHAASEIAYVLSRWRRGAVLDLVVLTSGPTMTRLDQGCLGAEADAAWPSRCERIIPGCSLFCDEQACTFDASTAAVVDGSFGGRAVCGGSHSDAEDLLAASLLAPEAAIDFPRTFVQVFTGTLDCTAAVPFALEWANALTSERDMRCVHAVNAPLTETSDGAAAILEVVRRECVDRH